MKDNILGTKILNSLPAMEGKVIKKVILDEDVVFIGFNDKTLAAFELAFNFELRMMQPARVFHVLKEREKSLTRKIAAADIFDVYEYEQFLKKQMEERAKKVEETERIERETYERLKEKFEGQ